jgi:cell division protein FtsI/penicillin-binding protein 2
MTQAIAHNGRLCPASLLKDGQIWCKDLALQQEHLDLVVSGMLAACSAGGTAYPLFKFNQKQPFIACKTGTAEFGAADERGYRRTHAWLTAIVYLDQADGYVLQEPWRSAESSFPTQLIITVLVESDQDKPFKEGSADAAPVVERILSGLLGEDSTATSAATTQD